MATTLRLRIVQSIVMAYVQFFLPLLVWRKIDIDNFMSSALELLWKSKHHSKGIRILSRMKICSPKMHGGLNILDICYHVLARKSSMLLIFLEQKQPWTHMLVAMCDSITTIAYGKWHVPFWDIVMG